MNIFYMGENLTESKFPITVWNTQVPRNVPGTTVCPAEEYEPKMSMWGDNEGIPGVSPDAGLHYNNNTDRDRKDTIPNKENET